MDKEKIGKFAKVAALGVGKILLDVGKTMYKEAVNQSKAAKGLSEDDLRNQYKNAKSGTFEKQAAKTELRKNHGYDDMDLEFLDLEKDLDKE